MGLGSGIRDPGSGKKPIPDPGSGPRVIKAPDPGAATLITSFLFANKFSRIQQGREAGGGADVAAGAPAEQGG
jgi:hypothetical protein